MLRIIYAQEDLPRENIKTIFLAGPTSRGNISTSWRLEAISFFKKLSLKENLCLFIPEFKDSSKELILDKEAQISWESKALEFSTVILFWVPRNNSDMLGLTTNDEWGYWRSREPGKLVFGAPKDSFRTSYQRFNARKIGLPDLFSLEESCEYAFSKIFNTKSDLVESILAAPNPYGVIKDHNLSNYSYFERLGIDSVAFILKNQSTGLFGLISERKPPIDYRAFSEKAFVKFSGIDFSNNDHRVFMTSAFGGSNDKSSLKSYLNMTMYERIDNMKDIVLAEVSEEAGYKVSLSNIDFTSMDLVSTQSNQFCFLFIVDITNSEFVGINPETPWEAEASTVWLKKEEILSLYDWKSKSIISNI